MFNLFNANTKVLIIPILSSDHKPSVDYDAIFVLNKTRQSAATALNVLSSGYPIKHCTAKTILTSLTKSSKWLFTIKHIKPFLDFRLRVFCFQLTDKF